MAFLRNKTVNLLNIHYGLHALASSAGGAFFAAYMLKAGIKPQVVLLAYALLFASRFAIRPLVLVIGKRVGLKPLIVAGSILMALQYPIVAQIKGVDVFLLTYCIVSALADVFYWTSYHAYFASLGDAEHRGHQTSLREAAVSLIGIVAPIVGAWGLANVGANITFLAAAGVQLLSVLPLIGTPPQPVLRDVDGAFKAALQGVRFFIADGLISSGLYMAWPVALFVSLSNSYGAFGGAMALAALVGAIGGLILGRFVDQGHGSRLIWPVFAILFVSILARVLAPNAAMAVLANALGAVVGLLYVPLFMTAVYNLSQRSPCPLRFQLAAEGGWDTGAVAGCLMAAGLMALGASIQTVILISLVGATINLVLVRRYYLDEDAALAAQAVEV